MADGMVGRKIPAYFPGGYNFYQCEINKRSFFINRGTKKKNRMICVSVLSRSGFVIYERTGLPSAVPHSKIFLLFWLRRIMGECLSPQQTFWRNRKEWTLAWRSQMQEQLFPTCSFLTTDPNSPANY